MISLNTLISQAKDHYAHILIGNMAMSALIDLDSYNPCHLLNVLHNKLAAKNDAQLSKVLAISPSNICKIRKKLKPVTASTLLAMHEVSGISIRELRQLMGDTRALF